MTGHMTLENRIKEFLTTLEDKDGLVRQKARESLVGIGTASTPGLALLLANAKSHQVRWEAAKALGALKDTVGIPALVKALEDTDTDVSWLAAEALNAFGSAAWPVLLLALVEGGTYSVRLREGAHHVFQNQKNEKYDDLLAPLMKALEFGSLPEAAPMVAHDILKRMHA